MTSPAATASAELHQLGRFARRRVVLVGNPNTGKSTVFNAITGLRQRVANYPGVTVEVKIGSLQVGSTLLQLVDLPGMYSLAAHSPDELVALDELLGRHEAPPDAVVVLADATNLERNLFLVSQLLELDLPVVVALSMVDLAAAQGLEVDARTLSKKLGIPVVPVVATHGQGLDELGEAVAEAVSSPPPPHPELLPEIHAEAGRLREELDGRVKLSHVEAERALIDRLGSIETAVVEAAGEEVRSELERRRGALGRGQSLAEIEAEARYEWAGAVVGDVVKRADRRGLGITERVDRFLAHPVFGTLAFLGLMALAFQAVFSWAAPIMDVIDGGAGALGDVVGSALPEGALSSVIVDGVIAGVGSVIVFLPQIVILFAFILLLEDSGYMSRAAFMVDRLMRLCGLSGQSFIPMLSSFACAVPAILSTRVIPGRRDRLATVLAAPFMTCSARLPVYALLIGAFVPQQTYLGFVNLQGLVLLALYLLGIVGGVTTALILKSTLLRGPTPTFLIEMPPYRWPSLRSVAVRLWSRVRAFLVRAGTIIFMVTVIVWALSYFPRPVSIATAHDELRQRAQGQLAGEALDDRLAEIDNLQAAAYLEQSALGRLGHLVEPVFRPLGWDWRVSSGVLSSFPAREIVIASLGTIYAVGSEVDEADEGLVSNIRSSTWPDGRPVFNLPMALGLMVFFALCLQCGATVAAIARESGGWGWPAFAWCYMTGLGYVAAFLTYRIGLWLMGA